VKVVEKHACNKVQGVLWFKFIKENQKLARHAWEIFERSENLGASLSFLLYSVKRPKSSTLGNRCRWAIRNLIIGALLDAKKLLKVNDYE
jgi:hypothetical protein